MTMSRGQICSVCNDRRDEGEAELLNSLLGFDTHSERISVEYKEI